jgi:hypothetical protein
VLVGVSAYGRGSRGVVLGDSGIVGDGMDGTYVTHETNERRRLRLAVKVSFWVGRASSAYKSHGSH